MSEVLRPVQSLQSTDILEFGRKGNRPDLIIVGLGPIGAACAYYLSYFMRQDNPEVKICALGAADQIGAGQNIYSFEQFRGGWMPPELLRFMQYSDGFFDNPNQVAPGLQPHKFDRQQMYYAWLFTSDEDRERFTKRAQDMQAAGYRKAYLIDDKDLTKLYPFTEGYAQGALLDTGAGRVNSVLLAQQFALHALDNTSLFVNAPVTEILTDKAGHKVRGVRTPIGIINAPKVLLCNGHMARRLAQTAGADIPTRAHRRESYGRSWTHIEKWASEGVPPGFFITPNGAYFRQQGVGIFSAWADPPKEFIDPVIEDMPQVPAPRSDYFPQVLLAELATHFGNGFADPRYLSRRSDVEQSAGWYCLRDGPNGSDDRQILDETPVKGLYVITAFGGHGVMASPAAGVYSINVLKGENNVHAHLSPFTISAQPPSTDNATI